MDLKNLLNGEEIILESGNNDLVLTNYRVVYQYILFGNQQYTSIALEKISSCEMLFKSNILILILGIILLPAMGLGIIFLIWYYFSRTRVVSIESDGGAEIIFKTKGLSKQKTLEFINQVENQKRNNFMNISSNNTTLNKEIVKQNTENLFK